MPKRLQKIVLILIAAVAVLAIAASAYLAWVFDANSLRDKIETAVLKKTGRELTIAGDIELRFFPRLRVEVTDVTLADDPVFADSDKPEPMLIISQVTADARIWKYLLRLGRKPIEFGSIHIDGLRANLIKGVDERSNWDTLLSGSGNESINNGTADTIDKSSKVNLGKVKIKNLDLNYHRRPDQQLVQLTKSGLTTSAFRTGQAVSFDLSGGVTITDTSDDTLESMLMTMQMNGKIVDDWQASAFTIKTPRIDIELEQGPALLKSHRFQVSADNMTYSDGDYAFSSSDIELTPMDDVKVIWLPLTGVVNINNLKLTDQQLYVDDARWDLSTPGQSHALPITGQLNNAYWRRDHDTFELQLAQGSVAELPYSLSAIGQLSPAPKTFKGRLDLASFSPRQVAMKLGTPLSLTRDKNAYKSASFSSKFAATDQFIEFNNFAASLDGSKLSGSLAFDIAKTKLTTSINVDQLDVDRYLAPTSIQTSTADSRALKTISSAPAQRIDVTANVVIDKARASGIDAENVDFSVQGNKNRWRVFPAKAKLLGGFYSGDVTVDLTTEAAVINVNEQFTDIDLATASQVLFGNKQIEGTLSGGLRATLTGSSSTDWIDSTQGILSINARDGRWNGMDLPYEIRKGLANARGDQPPEPPADPHTPFDFLRGDININEENLLTEKLVLQLPYLKLDAKGGLNIHSLGIDFEVGAKLLDSEQLRASEKDWVGHRIPVQIGGTLLAPEVDRGALAAELAVLYAKIKLADKIDLPFRDRDDQEKQDEVKEKIEKKKEELHEDIRDSLKELFD